MPEHPNIMTDAQRAASARTGASTCTSSMPRRTTRWPTTGRNTSGGWLSTAGSLELSFATPSYITCESVHADVPCRQDIAHEGFALEEKGQIVRPDEEPGLGIEVDGAQIKNHPFEQEALRRIF